MQPHNEVTEVPQETIMGDGGCTDQRAIHIDLGDVSMSPVGFGIDSPMVNKVHDEVQLIIIGVIDHFLQCYDVGVILFA